MKQNTLLLVTLATLFTASAAYAKNVDVIYVSSSSVNGAKKNNYNIEKYGAVGDSKTLNTKAIQAAIDQCAQKGGGTVLIPKGVFLSGALFLKSKVNIQFEEGGVLRGSQDINDYPKIETRIEGHFEPWRAALLNGDHINHFKMTGPGTLDGNGKPFWLEFYSRRKADPKTTNLNVERPRLTFIRDSKNVKIKGITYLNSGFWNLHLYHCEKVTVEDCRFQAPCGAVPDNHAPSSDGIDLDSDRDVTIRHCFFSVGDDDIALKGSKGPFALQDKNSPPVENIKILDCEFEAGGGIMTCGSEATIVRNVTVKRCITHGPTVLRLKLRPDTPQQYEKIRIKDITLDNSSEIFRISPWTQYFDLKGQAPPKSVINDVKISHIHGSATNFGEINGHPQAAISNITLEDADLQLKKPDLKLGKVKGLEFKDVKVNGAVMPTPGAEK